MTRTPPTAYWHALPLHYAPHLLTAGALLSQDELAARSLPIRPRATAERRDRKLGLSGYVHLSFAGATPLLADKRAKGYPHLLVSFAAAVAEESGAHFVGYNAKAWRHRDDFAPVTGAAAKAAFLVAWQVGRYPSAELLVERELPLAPHGIAIHAASESEAAWLGEMVAALGLACPLPVRVTPELFPAGPEPDMVPYWAYAIDCRSAGWLLPPPDLPFD